MPDFLNGLFFSEIVADNAGCGALDVNGDGVANKQDEYVEIQNKTGSTIDLAGYQIWSDRHGLLRSFRTGDQIAVGGTATVVGTYTNPPTGFYGASGNNNSPSSRGGCLEDGEGGKSDTIYLVAPEPFYPGPMAVGSVDKKILEERVDLFPGLADPTAAEAAIFARPPIRPSSPNGQGLKVGTSSGS